MDLRTEDACGVRVCFVNRFLSKHVVIWPQRPDVRPEPSQMGNLSMGKWKAYVNVHERVTYPYLGEQRPLRAGHKDIQVCSAHWDRLKINWIQIAWEEVWLDYLFHQSVDRMD